jgi:hypothetical protein
VSRSDPIEAMIAYALTEAGIAFERERDGLDFYLPSLGVFIECKQFHSERSAAQLARAPNVILVQGAEAAKLVAWLITRARDYEE